MPLFRPVTVVHLFVLAVLGLLIARTARGQAAYPPQQIAYARAASLSHEAWLGTLSRNERSAVRVTPRMHPEDEQVLFREVNRERASAGLTQLTWSAPLTGATAAHANQLQVHGELSHKFDDEADLPLRAAATGARFSRVAENVAHGHEVMSLHRSLMNSQHHRENILDPQVDAMAISVLEADGALWIVEDFIKSAEALTLEQQEARVLTALLQNKMPAEAAADARSVCSRTGAAANRPDMIARYTTKDPAQLPEQLLIRLAAGTYRHAVVGACEATSDPAFTTFHLALLLFH